MRSRSEAWSLRRRRKAATVLLWSATVAFDRGRFVGRIAIGPELATN